MKIEDGYLIGTVHILNPQNGKHLKEIVSAGVDIEYSTMGTGTVTKNPDGTKTVSDYSLIYINVTPK